MKFLHKIHQILHQQDQNQSHKYLWLIAIAFAFKFAYGPFHSEDLYDFFPLVDNPLMDKRNYVYLLGERIFIAVLFLVLHWYAKSWITFWLWFAETLYILDFFFFYHTTWFGEIKMVLLGITFLPLFLKWMRR